MRAAALSGFSSALVLAVLAAIWLSGEVERHMQTPMNVPEGGHRLIVAHGDSLARITERLAADSILERPAFIVWHARWHERDRGLKAGEYHLKAGMTPSGLLDRMERGDVVQYSVTLIEGWSWRRALAAIRAHEMVRPTLKATTAEEVAQALGLSTPHPEGWLFPDTYLFPRGTTDLELLRKAHQAMLDRLAAEWDERAEGLPYRSRYEALILASIVEKETGAPDERARIAGVFVRRLRLGMRLETDPTVIYGLGDEFDGNLTRKHLRQDTPYNTYLHHGLTPTPIALPGAAALRAALHPAPGDDLFFVASENGRHVFSRTYAEHRAAVNVWQRRRRGGK